MEMILNGGNENSVSFKTAGITKEIIKLEFEGILSKQFDANNFHKTLGKSNG
jgi:hypothetical protein